MFLYSNSGKLLEVLISSFSLINEFSFKELTLFIGKVFLLFEEELIDFDGDEITSLSFPFSLLLFKLLFLL